jgi:phage shock protein A
MGLKMLLDKTSHMIEGIYNGILETITPPEKMAEYDRELLETKKKQIDEQLIKARTEFNKLNGVLGKQATDIKNVDAAADIELRNGNDDQAGKFLKQKAQMLENYTATKSRMDALNKNISDLENASKMAKLAIEETQTRIANALINHKISGAELTIAETIHGVSKESDNFDRDIDRLEGKAENQTARASAIRDLAASGSIGNDGPKTAQDTLLEDRANKELLDKKIAMGLIQKPVEVIPETTFVPDSTPDNYRPEKD